MSMILDALTRAEHERQIEKQPDLNFVSPIRQKPKKPNYTWIIVTFALLLNAVVIALFIRPDSNDVASTVVSGNSVVEMTHSKLQISNAIDQNSISQQVVVSEANSRPLAMEFNEIKEGLDRPLIYESKNTSTSQSATTQKTVKQGKVSFSNKQLSVNNNEFKQNTAPKLLIDQSDSRAVAMTVPQLRDMPENTRLKLSQYEVNVHVYDDDPNRRFVLINMDKYKQGDRIANNGPYIDKITQEGVVVDYGNGLVLLPPK